MIYKAKDDNKEYFFTVKYDEEQLRKILEELKSYKHVIKGHAQISGHVTKFPATYSLVKKRTIAFFKKFKDHPNAEIDSESIVHHTEKGHHYVTYDYSYETLPELYDYLDLLVNGGNPARCKHLFRDARGNFDWYTYLHNSSQVIMDGILNYTYSPELDNYSSTNDGFDYVGLNKLYKRTLESFNFSLNAVKENVHGSSPIDGVVLQKQRITGFSQTKGDKKD